MAAWIIPSEIALDQAGLRANPVAAALGLVSIAAKADTSKVNVLSGKEDKGRVVETRESRPRAGRPQHQGCMSCPETTALLDRLIRSLVISEFICLHSIECLVWNLEWLGDSDVGLI